MTHTHNKAAAGWIAVLLLLIAFGLRLYRLDAQDIWGDEAMSIFVSALPIGQALVAETNPPAYFWLLSFGRAMWGSSVFGLRVLSLFCGTLTVALIATCGRRIAGTQLACWALLVAAFSPFLVYYSQEARMYATVQLGAAGSLLLFLYIVQQMRAVRPISPPIWLTYIAFSLLMLFSHYYGFALLIAQGILALVLTRRLPVWLLAWSGMAALFVPYFLYHRSFWSEQTSLRSEEWAIAALFEIVSRTMSAFSLGTSVSGDELYWIVPLLLLVCIGMITLLMWHKTAGLVLGLSLVIGLVFAWAITPLLPFFWERYLIPILPAFLLLLAAGAFGLTRLRHWLALPLVLLILLPSMRSIGNYYFEPQYVKGGYGQAMRLIADRGKDGDFILLNGPLQAMLFDYYQPEGYSGSVIPRGELLSGESTDAWMKETTDSYRRIWLVESGNPAEFDPDGVARGWLAENGLFALHRDFPGVGVDLFLLGGDSAETEAQTPTDYNFSDEVQLLGYSVDNSTDYVPGDPVLLTLYWQALQPLENAYTVYTHILNEDGALVAQTDRQPVGGSRPTNTWQVGETIVDRYAILLPEEALHGSYIIEVGLYLWPSLDRLNLQGDVIRDSATLAAIRIKRDP